MLYLIASHEMAVPKVCRTSGDLWRVVVLICNNDKETIIIHWGIYWGYMGIMENRMETTTCSPERANLVAFLSPP